MTAWCSGNGVQHIDEVTVRQARLVLGWVTVRGYIVLVCSHHSGQLSLLPSLERKISVGQGYVAMLYSWEGNRRSGNGLAMRHTGIYPPAGPMTQGMKRNTPPSLLEGLRQLFTILHFKEINIRDQSKH